ncbi:hypothetical protein ACGWY0_002808 [Enterococcus hirae]
MNITVKELGEPIELEDYLEEYKFQVIFLLKNMTFIDRKDNRVRQLFNMELIRAETKWYSFYQKNHRPPDYNFLQEEITSFGVNRLPMFDRRNEGRVNDELSVDNFVHYHIQQLKLEKILSPVFFEKKEMPDLFSLDQIIAIIGSVAVVITAVAKASDSILAWLKFKKEQKK